MLKVSEAEKRIKAKNKRNQDYKDNFLMQRIAAGKNTDLYKAGKKINKTL